MITLNTDSELDDVLAMHALFTQVAPVKFEIYVHGQENFVIPSSITNNINFISNTHTNTSTRTSSVVGEPLGQLTAWSLNHHDRAYENDDLERDSTATITTQDTPLHRHCFGSEQSDDVSLIELEDGMDTRLGEELQRTSAAENVVEQAIAYPQQDLEEAARLQEEMDRLEAYKIEAPVFTSSILGNNRSTVVDESMETSFVASTVQGADEEPVFSELPPGTVTATVEHYETLSTRSHLSGSTTSVPSSPVTEFGSMRLEDAPAVMEDIVASAVEQHSHETNSSESTESKEEVEADADPEEHAVPSTATASTSTSERPMSTDDRALIEQFQLLIKEFQEIIQNNPQLVAIAGSILNKVTFVPGMSVDQGYDAYLRLYLTHHLHNRS